VRLVRVAALASIFAAAIPIGVMAQQAPTFRPGAFTVSGGALLTGGYPVGDVTATLRRNAPGTPSPFTMLRAESAFDLAFGVEGRVGYALSEQWSVEAGGSFSRPQLAVVISQDAEFAGAPSISSAVDQYMVDGRAVYQLPFSFGRRARPYVLGGAGYLRQLHEERVLAETGYTLQFGGGVQYWWRTGTARQRPLGVRGEARLVRRQGGVEYEDRARQFPVFSLLAFIGF
jgi:hypothetical protein